MDTNAQRAGDIVTRTAQPRVYVLVTASSPSSQRVRSPGPLREKDRRTGTWQMIVPRTETSCDVFGTNDLASLAGLRARIPLRMRLITAGLQVPVSRTGGVARSRATRE